MKGNKRGQRKAKRRERRQDKGKTERENCYCCSFILRAFRHISRDKIVDFYGTSHERMTFFVDHANFWSGSHSWTVCASVKNTQILLL